MTTDNFPYLVMNMTLDANQNLCFGVHTKTGFKIRYLNVESSHTNACKWAVPRGISICITGLTTQKANNNDISLSDIYSKTHRPKQAGYLKNNKLTKLGDILDKQDIEITVASIQKEE